MANRGNAADHVQAIEHFEEEPDSHTFARCVIRGHQQIPAIIIYIDEQLQDISPPIHLLMRVYLFLSQQEGNIQARYCGPKPTFSIPSQVMLENREDDVPYSCL